jgi:hypothetical protein
MILAFQEVDRKCCSILGAKVLMNSGLQCKVWCLNRWECHCMEHAVYQLLAWHGLSCIAAGEPGQRPGVLVSWRFCVLVLL